MAGCVYGGRAWLLGTGVSWLSCHKELDSVPQGPADQTEIRPRNSGKGGPPAAQRGAGGGGWTQGPSDLHVLIGTKNRGNRESPRNRDLSMGKRQIERCTETETKVGERRGKAVR